MLDCSHGTWALAKAEGTPSKRCRNWLIWIWYKHYVIELCCILYDSITQAQVVQFESIGFQKNSSSFKDWLYFSQMCFATNALWSGIPVQGNTQTNVSIEGQGAWILKTVFLFVCFSFWGGFSSNFLWNAKIKIKHPQALWERNIQVMRQWITSFSLPF